MAEDSTKSSVELAAERDRDWLEKTFIGGTQPELTLRAIFMGLILGAVLSLSNLYVGFKTGWGLGVTITAAIMAYAIYKALRAVMPFWIKTDFTILENNIMQTTASASAYVASAGLVSAIPALTMVTGRTIPVWQLMLWILSILYLGLFVAIPLKRQMINVENLKFPTGFATAEVLKGMHTHGEESLKKARALFSALGLGLLVAWCRDGVIGAPVFAGGLRVAKDWGVWTWKRWLPSIPATMIPASWNISGIALSRLTLSFEGSLIMAGAGAIMGIRVGVSLLVAAIAGYGILAPILIRKGEILHPAPAVVARHGFGGMPEIYSEDEIYFPVKVAAGESLTFELFSGANPPQRMSLTWQAAAVYESAKELEGALASDQLPGGGPNPFKGKVQFRVDGEKNHLCATIAGTPAEITTLKVSRGTGMPALGFKPGDSSKQLCFPLAVPAGSSLAFLAGEKAGPGGDEVKQALAYTWPYEKTYSGEKELLADLNSQNLLSGAQNPMHGKISFEIRRKSLAAIATANRRWDSSLEVIQTPAGAFLGFGDGQRRAENCGGFRNIVSWLMWPGVAMMVTSGLLSFFLQWRTVARAFSGVATMFSKKRAGEQADPMDAVEVPASWFAAGMLAAGIVAMILQVVFFSIHWWMAVIAVVMAFFLAIVACRATGETDITPIGAMGKITQLLYGVLAPGNMSTNLMTANVTGGAATSSADLLQAMKCGYVLGASPRKQFFGQFLGVIIGTLVCIPIYFVLVPTTDVLGTDKLPAPAAQVWAGVAMLLSNGFTALPITARWALLVGGLLGIAITLCEKLYPKSRSFLPSPTGMGIALVIPAFQSVSMFLGAFIAWMVEKMAPKTGETYTVPVASGIIAGESLMGIAVAVAQNALRWIP